MLTERITDYRDACKFLMEKIGDRKRALSYLEIAEEFQNLKQTLVSGKKIDVLKLHPPISPVVILGYDESTRIEKFNLVINELNSNLEEHKEKARKLIEGSKQVKKQEQKDHFQQLAKQEIEKANDFKNKILLVNQKKKNPWQAPPISHYETVFQKKEKVMEEVKQGSIKLLFKTSDTLKKSGAYVKVSFEVNEKNKLTEKFAVEKDGEGVWLIDDKAAEKLIDKKDVVVALKRKRFLRGPEVLDQKSFKLSNLGQKCEMSKEIKFKGGECELIFQIHTPIRGKEFEEVPIKKLVID